MADTLRSYRPRTLPRATGGSPESNSIAPTPTKAIGFDETAFAVFTSTVVGSGIGRFGSFVILTVPQQIERVEIKKLAVYGSPEGFVLSETWWALQLAGGAVQEFVPETNYLTNATLSDGGFHDQPTVGGVRFTRYGSLEHPQDVAIEIRQSGTLEVVVFTRFAGTIRRPVTYWARVAGSIHYPAGAGA